jgi:hypothetical protein
VTLEQMTVEHMTRTVNEAMHEAFGTSSEKDEEEKIQGERRVRSRRTGSAAACQLQVL